MHVVLCRIVYVTNTFEFDLISYVWVSVQFMFSVTQSDISVAKFHVRFKIKTCGGKHFWHNAMCSVETSAFHSFWNTSCSFVDSGKPDAVWPVYSWLGLLFTVPSVQVPLSLQINEAWKLIGFIHKADVWPFIISGWVTEDASLNNPPKGHPGSSCTFELYISIPAFHRFTGTLFC